MKTLIAVDFQVDFGVREFSHAALPVPHAPEALMNCVNILDNYDLVIATQDWHPEGHCSFKKWPPHCIQGRYGADLPYELVRKAHVIVRKGYLKDSDSYSGFLVGDNVGTGLTSLLHEKGIEEIDICGLAIDYCVRETVLDALVNGFKVNLILNASAGLDPLPTIEHLYKCGVNLK